MYNYTIKEGFLSLTVDASLYNQKIIKKTLLWYTSDFDFQIKKNKNTYIVSLIPKEENKSLRNVKKWENLYIELGNGLLKPIMHGSAMATIPYLCTCKNM